MVQENTCYSNSEDNITLTYAKPSDVGLIAKVINEVAEEGFSLGSEPALGRKTDVIRMITKMQLYKGQWILAWVNEQIAGVAGVVQLPEEQGKPSPTIFGICILKQFRKKGIGKLLTTNVINWCKHNNCTVIRLSVLEHNQIAVKLYEKYGFSVIGKNKTTRQVSGHFVEELIMEKTLN